MVKQRIGYTGLLLSLIACASPIAIPSTFAAPQDAAAKSVSGLPTPRCVMTRIKIMRAEVSVNGKVTEKLWMAPTITSIDGQPAKIGTSGTGGSDEVAILTHLRPDGDIDFTCSFAYSKSEPEGATHSGSISTNRRMKPNQAVRLGGTSEESDKRVQKALEKNKKLPAIGKSYTVLYIDASIAEMPAENQ